MTCQAKRTVLMALFAALPILTCCGGDDSDDPPSITTLASPSPSGSGAIPTTLFVTNQLTVPMRVSLTRPAQYVTPSASPTTGKVTHDLQPNGSFSLSATVPGGVEFAVEWGPANTNNIAGSGTCTLFSDNSNFRTLRIQIVSDDARGPRASCSGFTLTGE